MFQLFLQNLGFKRASWNFTETGHGKGTADGVGRTLKRLLDKTILHGKEITNANDVFTTLSEESKVQNITHIDSLLPGEDLKINQIENTLKLRQVVFENTKEDLYLRYLSCVHCTDECKHHGLVATT